MRSDDLFRILSGAGILLFALMPTSTRANAPAREGGSGIHGSLPLGEVSIELERTRCFGTCPVYRLSISGHGQVEYEGLDFVDAIGIHVSEIPIEAVAKLVDRFLQTRFFDAPDEYRTQDHAMLEGDRLILGQIFVSDNPSTILRLKLGEKQKEVVLYYNFPVEYGQLADEIDRVAGTDPWVRGGESVATPRAGRP